MYVLKRNYPWDCCCDSPYADATKVGQIRALAGDDHAFGVAHWQQCLVHGPILDTPYGKFTPLVMVALYLGAYLLGPIIRFNISVIDQNQNTRSKLEHHLDVAASWGLAFAYIISAFYYLNLFGAFGVSLLSVDDPFHANLLTSAVFRVIISVDWIYGLKAIERMEQISVSIKLAIIAGLLICQIAHVFQRTELATNETVPSV